jgi:HEAT repeat protein
MNPLSCVLALSSLVAADSGPPVDCRMGCAGPTRQAERLLRIAEDEGRSSEERVRAIDQLGQRREAATVPRLLRLLSGGDVVTLRAVIALRQIGDRRALPALRKLRDDPNNKLPGKIYAALHETIDVLTKSRR